MKKLLGSILGISLLLASLTACSQKQTTATGQQGGGPGASGTPGQMQLPTEMQMLLGTFKLEGTDQAVTAEQASTLLPLWKAYRTMIADDTAASNEISSLTTQIHDSMTADQLSAIEDMNLSVEDFSAVAQEQGVSTQAAQQDDSSSSSSAGGFGGGMGGPGGGGGGMPAGGGMGGGSMPSQGSETGTEVAGEAAPSMSSMLVDSPLLDKLVELLESRAAS